MITQQHPREQIHVHPERPVRCLRHRVWMAVCDDCRAARAELLGEARKRNAAG